MTLLFLFWWKNALHYTWFEDTVTRFTNGFITKFNGVTTDHIGIMSFLFESCLLILPLISSIKSDFSVIAGKSDGNVLLWSINEHCFARKELKILLFSLKSEIILFLLKSGGIQESFLPFKRVFNRNQQHLGVVDGSKFFWDVPVVFKLKKNWLNFVIKL